MLSNIHSNLLPLAVPVEDLRPHPDNPREHDDDIIRESLILNGQFSPVLVQASTGRLLAGHGTYSAAISLGWTHVAAVSLDLDDEQALRVLLADNRTNELGSNDPTALLNLLRRLDGEFGGSGYSSSDFTALLSTVESVTADLVPTDFEPTNASLRTLSLSYPADTFDELCGWLMELRAEEGDTFTDVVQRLVADELEATS